MSIPFIFTMYGRLRSTVYTHSIIYQFIVPLHHNTFYARRITFCALGLAVYDLRFTVYNSGLRFAACDFRHAVSYGVRFMVPMVYGLRFRFDG